MDGVAVQQTDHLIAVIVVRGAIVDKFLTLRGNRHWSSVDGQGAGRTLRDMAELVGHICAILEDMELRHGVHCLLTRARRHVRHRAVCRGRPGEAFRNTCHREVFMFRLGQRRAVVSLAAAARNHRDGSTVLADGQRAFLQRDVVVRRVVADGDAAFRDGDVIGACCCAGSRQCNSRNAMTDSKTLAIGSSVHYRVIGAHCIACRSVGDGTASIFVAGIVGFQRNRTGGDGQRARGARVDA